jgi:hypothetical protein
MSIGIISIAGGPDCPNASKQSSSKKRGRGEVSSKKHMKKVVNANPQHAGYPKADAKGDFPMRIDKNTYYIEE